MLLIQLLGGIPIGEDIIPFLNPDSTSHVGISSRPIKFQSPCKHVLHSIKSEKKLNQTYLLLQYTLLLLPKKLIKENLNNFIKFG